MNSTRNRTSRDEYAASNVYVSSSPADDSWGQPPASHYVLWVEGTRIIGTRIQGVYVSTTSPSQIASAQLSGEMKDQFDAWDSLSDEALLEFEASLDE